ncbi:MAG: tetratricopeptide repeat protein [Desulfobacteraceae bacterium]|nr:tetratricopeptide repeat protein [Desulfobacteraceae bacterium]
MQTHLNLIGKHLDQFRVDKFIARGAMGLVYKAFDTVLVRTVALKLIPRITPEDLSPQEVATIEEARKRLIQEAKAAGRLSHPNIVTIHSYGETEEYEYICMEYVSGKTMAELLNAEKVISPENAVSIFEQILMALDAANKEQIVHRDIKPSNIMLTEDGRVKVMDFGIAKLPSLSMTVTGTVLGTPYYMSPEQISGQKIDIRSDLFSLGAVLYEALTGERPFAAENTATLAYKIVQTDPVPPKILNVHIPQALGAIISKALVKDPAKRYQTPREMLEALRASMKKPAEAPADATVISAGPAFEATIQISREGIKEEAGQMAEAASAAPEKAEKKAERLEPVEPAPGASVLHAPKEKTPKPDGSDAKAGQGGAAGALPDQPAKRVHGEESGKPKPGEGDKKKGTSPAVAVAAVLAVLLIGGAAYFLLKPASRQPVQETQQAAETTIPAQKPAAQPPVTQPPVTQPPVTQPPAAALPKAKPDISDQTKSVADSLVVQARGQWQKNPADAQRLLEEAIALDPGNFEATLQLGRLLSSRKDFPAAIVQFQKALQLNSRSAEVYFNLGYIYLTLGDLDGAINNYEACWALAPPNQDEVLTNLGVTYLRKNNPSQAQGLFRQALDLNPGNSVARNYLASSGPAAQQQDSQQKAPDAAPQQVQPAVQTEAQPQTRQAAIGQQPEAPEPIQPAPILPQPREEAPAPVQPAPDIPLLIANAMSARESNPAESEKLFGEVLSHDPNNLEALMQMGRFLTLRKDYPGAVQYYQSVLKANKENADAYFNLGFVFLNLKSYDAAKKHYEECLALSPPYKDEVLTNIGIIELRQKNTARARQLFKEALELNPNNTKARNSLANIAKGGR